MFKDTSVMSHFLLVVLLASVTGTTANIATSGVLHTVLGSDVITCDHDRQLDLDVSQVEVFFYDFANNVNLSFPIQEAAEKITSFHNLDVTKRLLLFNPGYKSHIFKKTEEKVRQAFREVPNIYLIILDHSAYTSAKGGKVNSYERSVKYVYYIGRAIAQFLVSLKNKGFPSKQMHCVGHSLGAQMLGHTGELYTNITNEKIWRITGLDPAGPCFSFSYINEQLRSGVAEYVEVYHCNAGVLGTTSVLADIDFFFNREGSSQPNCSSSAIAILGSYDTAKCSHKACLQYWTMSVSNSMSLLAWSCASYKSFVKGKCAANEVTLAGYWNPGNATGTFYVFADN